MSLLDEIKTHCPYCGETITLVIDNSETEQSYIEDCQVCCRPITVLVAIDEKGEPVVNVQQENDC